MNSIKKYGAEFLILFLAVFLGALAENFREQYQELKQGREYLSRFYQDLYSDLAVIDQTLLATEAKLKRLKEIDSLKNHVPTDIEGYIEVVGRIRGASVWQRSIYVPNNITLDQIKSTGAWDFITEEQSDIITSYQISVERILQYNGILLQDIRETFDLVKRIPQDNKRYKKGDFNNRELQTLHNYINELYWSHSGYMNILNQHKYFITEVLQKLEDDHEIINKHIEYNIMANKISLIKIINNAITTTDDIFLIQNINDSNIWSNVIQLEDGQYIFRKGASNTSYWLTMNPNILEINSGKAISQDVKKDSKLFNIPDGKYYVELNFNDTTYLFQKVK